MRIAIIGGGISGLTAGYHLHQQFDVTLFEAHDYLGGHTNTFDVPTDNGSIAVDTGFIVFNDRTYPNFISMLNELSVPFQPTRMSFSVSCDQTGLEYSGTGLNGLFAQRKNVIRPWFYRLLMDFGRFKKDAQLLLESDQPQESVGDFFDRRNYSPQFVEQYFLPMGAAIWSASTGSFEDFPIRFICQFYKNHGLLGISDRPQWRVIQGGSKSYVNPLISPFEDRIRLNTKVASVRRVSRISDPTGEPEIELKTSEGDTFTFDHVVFGCHSDQALAILGDDASENEREILSAFPYQKNIAKLHTQADVLPVRRKAWASWNYFNPTQQSGAATVTYNMNILQSLKCKSVFCVTLNDDHRIKDENVLRSFTYHHPTFNLRRREMQQRHLELINQNGTSFCGAYWGNGFHEDGVVSGQVVANSLLTVSVGC